MTKVNNAPARQIVAALLVRERHAQKRYRRAKTDPSMRCSEFVLIHLEGLVAEAHNAAETARRILHCGMQAL